MPSKARATAAGAEQDDIGGPRILKKYPNRRLYDTRTSSYITLVDVKAMVMGGEEFEVRDAKSGEDLTRSILLQIILEEETGGVPIFSTLMLSQLIRFYGHAMQGMMGAYLEKNLQTFIDLQTKFAAPGKGLYDAKAYTPEAWTQFLKGQSPVMGNLMTAYVEQSTSLFKQMQEQMQKSSAGFFPGMPGFPPKK
jgi:polyhydroxyalkanoate synthesis repressor PhaR